MPVPLIRPIGMQLRNSKTHPCCKNKDAARVLHLHLESAHP